ncbi:MAG: response regulator [Lachnospiraceae bacterium]|nr:response regulator [Lachnospiraceae bacterium]
MDNKTKDSIIFDVCRTLVHFEECKGVRQCLEIVGKGMGIDGGLVMRTNEIPFLLEMRCMWDPSHKIRDDRLMLDYSSNPDNELLNPFGKDGRLNVVYDVDAEEFDPVTRGFFDAVGAKAFVGCSMVMDKDYLGGMCFYRFEKYEWSELELDTIREVTSLVSYVVSRMKLNESFHYLLEQANKNYNEADNAKARFLTNITNEMRTPLNSAMGMISIMRHNIQSPDVTADCIGRMENLIKQLIDLVADCADMSLVKGLDHELNRIWVTLEYVISGVRKFVDPLAAGKKQHIDYKFDPELSILADDIKLARIIINAVNNSCRNSPESTDISVSFRIEPTGSKQTMLIISVKDENSEFDPENVLRVFDPFVSIMGKSGTSNSTGVNMAITKHLTEMMNGSCEFFADGAGTEFVASIPVEVKGDTRLSAPAAQPEEEPNEYSEVYIGRRILIVEDNMVMGEILATLMGYRGLETDVVLNGKEACDAYLTHDAFYYDMIFMDIQMPVMDGVEATKQIRGSNMQDAAIIPIIALSATSLPEDSMNAKNAGMNAYLHKPVDEKELFITIDKFLI